MTTTAAYRLSSFDAVLRHGAWPSFEVHDLPGNTEELHARALAASGDYFEMLAAELEQVAVALPLHSIEQYQLQHYVGQLLYLQRHYRITKK